MTCFLLLLWSLSAWSQTVDTPISDGQGVKARRYATHSVLSSGTWYKIGVPASGMYKIDQAALRAMGIQTSNLNPQYIRLFGNGGGLLPQRNADPRPDDLIENALFVAGESDARFDEADYVLFYAQGPHSWSWNAATKQFRHQLNIYSDTAYYFLQVGQAPGLRVARSAPVAGVTATVTTYQERIFHEADLKNKLLSGREWVGEEFSAFTPARDFTFPLPDLLPQSVVRVTAAVVGDAPVENFFELKLNNTLIGTQNVPGIPGWRSYTYNLAGIHRVNSYEVGLSNIAYNGELKINIAYYNGGHSSALGYLDYLEILAEKPLKLAGNHTAFRSPQNIMPGAVSMFNVANMPAGALIWDITNPRHPQAPVLTFTGTTAAFTAKTDSLKEFIAFTGTDFPPPTFMGQVPNQNLHALNQDGQTDLVIITHPAFLSQAERLANHRQTHDRLRVQVVTTLQIYHEFSSGAQDVTAIRDFIKMVYERNAKGPDETLHLLLLGDASYDYKSPNTANSTNRTVNNTNYVPVYQSRQSLDPLGSYSSEDYYGFLDDPEGYWDENSFINPDLLDIGVGRLPVRTIEEAETVVTKLIRYDDPRTFGNWRNRVAFVADDGDGTEHLRDAEFLADFMATHYPAYNLRKIYLDMFPQPASAGGQSSPQTNLSIDQAIEQGALLVNYTGHGNATSLAQEKILTVPQINKWHNKDKLTFLVTATCEFGRYDDPVRLSGAEYSLLNPNGGAIGLISTTRPVYADGNRVFNKNFFELAFKPVNGRMPRLGDVLRLTKNTSLARVNNRNFALLGDPTMRLAAPNPNLQVSLDQINGSAAHTGTDTLKALSKITVAGSVRATNQTVAATFNGTVQVTVYEKQSLANTLGDESSNGMSNVLPVRVRKNILYDGLASVRSGSFTLTFLVPKDIAYNIGAGKISLYAFSEITDAQGVNQHVLVGGANAKAPLDGQPPAIQLFIDDESFVAGGLTLPDATLLARITDENGINTTGIGIGHELTAVLDGRNNESINLNNYFITDLDSYQSGKVKYTLKDLPIGKHEIRVKAWDTHNNSAESKINFVVVDSKKLTLAQVSNYPNPFDLRTTFRFNHNREGEDLWIQIKILTVSGSLVKTLTSVSLASKSHFSGIYWDGRNENNQSVAPGLYIYLLTVRSKFDGTEINRIEKLVLLN